MDDLQDTTPRTIDDPDVEVLLQLNALMTEKAVMKITTLSRASLHRKRLKGEFPMPLQVSDGRMAYRIQDIKAWLEAPATWPAPSSPDLS